MKYARPIAWLACAAAAAVFAAAPATPAHAQASAAWRTQAPYTQQELDQMLAPIALYPDALVAQVLMAATYPLEVVQAARFVQRNRGLGGEALERAVAPMGWDPSVAALTQCPSVLAMMSEELDWTQRLGEAFLAQREQVMDTVQSLRAKAYAAGSLRSTEQQHVIVQDRVIVIEPWQPGLLWVQYYNPVIGYGSWWWPGVGRGGGGGYPPFPVGPAGRLPPAILPGGLFGGHRLGAADRRAGIVVARPATGLAQPPDRRRQRARVQRDRHQRLGAATAGMASRHRAPAPRRVPHAGRARALPGAAPCARPACRTPAGPADRATCDLPAGRTNTLPARRAGAAGHANTAARA